MSLSVRGWSPSLLSRVGGRSVTQTVTAPADSDTTAQSGGTVVTGERGRNIALVGLLTLFGMLFIAGIGISAVSTVAAGEDVHLSQSETTEQSDGVITQTDLASEQYTEPGTYTYDVSDIDFIRVELDGPGGGGAAYDGEDEGDAGDGGPGGSVEAVFNVSEINQIEVYVGEGGGGGEDAAAGEGGDGRAAGGDGGLHDDPEFGFHAAGGGGGGETAIVAENETHTFPIAAADGGGGGGAWDADAGVCCDEAAGGGGGAGGQGGSASGEAATIDPALKDGQDAETVDDRGIIGGLGGSGGDAHSGEQIAEDGGSGGVWTNSDYIVRDIEENVGGGGEGGIGGSDIGTSGDDGFASVDEFPGPNFELQNVDAPERVEPGEDIAVTADIVNTGEFEDTQLVELVVEELDQDSIELTLEPDESDDVALSVPTAPGDEDIYTLTLSTHDDTFSQSVTVGADEAVFGLLNLDPTEATVERGDTLDVSVDVENVGTAEGTQTVFLQVDGDDVDEAEVTLPGESSDTISLTLDTTDLEEGEYTFTVVTGENELSGTLTVEPGDEDGSGLPIPLIGIGAVIAVAIVGGALFVMKGGDDEDSSSNSSTSSTSSGGTSTTTTTTGTTSTPSSSSGGTTTQAATTASTQQAADEDKEKASAELEDAWESVIDESDEAEEPAAVEDDADGADEPDQADEPQDADEGDEPDEEDTEEPTTEDDDTADKDDDTADEDEDDDMGGFEWGRPDDEDDS